MAFLWLAVLWVYCCVGASHASTVRQYGQAFSEEGAQWVVSIEKNNEKLCTGVQVSKEWILTLGDCIKTKKLSKYRIVTYDGEVRKIKRQEESPVQKMLVLLKTNIKTDDNQQYPGLARVSVFHTFRTYNRDEFGNDTAVDISLVSDEKCVDQGFTGWNTHKDDCFTADQNSSTECLAKPGLPIFGIADTETVLLGFSTNEGNLCDGSFKKAKRVAPHRRWMRNLLKGCGLLPSIDNGVLSLDKEFSSTVGSTASVSCDRGYTASKPEIVCEGSGTWQAAKCIINDCGSAPSVSDGSVSLTSTNTTYGSTATVICDPGYDSNQAAITCKANGRWKIPACTIKDCGSVQDLSDGSVSVIASTTTYGSIANVSCDTGYYTNKTTLACQANGLWEATPTCSIKDCDSVPSATDGSVRLTSTTTTYGSNATVNCDPGYDSNQTIITCQANGRWETPACTIKDCDSVPSVTDGSVSLTSTTTTYGSNATVNCDPGYDSNQTIITCQANGRWETPACTIKDCGSVQDLSDGSLSVTASTTTYGSIANVSCDTGYYTNKSTLACQANGRWEDTPTCSIKDCGSVPSVSDGSVSLTSSTTTYGSNATVQCDTDYESNQTTITCQTSGRWETPKCTANGCANSTEVSFDGTRFRLCDGDGSGSNGRVEVFLHNEWGTLCTPYLNWDTGIAEVACPMFGYRTGVATAWPGSGRIWLGELFCTTGNEVSLMDCFRGYVAQTTVNQFSFLTDTIYYYVTVSIYDIGEHVCQHSDDVGVSCQH